MYTGLQLSELVLSETGKPMNCEDMWRYVLENGYDKKSGIHGKTPWRTLQAQIYVDIRDNPDSKFIQLSSRPVLFGLKSIIYDSSKQVIIEKADRGRDFIERDLHPLLVSYLSGNPHFEGHTKTIHHESSSKAKKNAEKWMHPDLVSVHFPFEDLDSKTVELAKNVGISGIRLFSFEMKVSVNVSNVREYFFQAVSNSSWANEGYLVALEYTEDAIDLLSRLSSSFGIGAIRLDSRDVHQSEIIIPSRKNENLDLRIIDDLLNINKEFKSFIGSINDSMKTGRVIAADYDDVPDDSWLEEYIRRKKICRLVF